MAKYHINARGKATICRATKGGCPFGNEGEHFATEKEASDYFEKESQKEHGWLPGIVPDKNDEYGLVVDKNTEKNENAKEKRLTPAQIEAQAKKEQTARLTSKLEAYWKKRDGTPDEKMVNHCLKSSKYVEIDGSFVDVTDAKPTIHNEMYYDDEGSSPGVNFENFRNYNLRMEMPKTYDIEGRNRDGIGNLKITPQYDGSQGFGLSSLTYEDEPNTEYQDVTEEQLKKINEGIEEVKSDYEKRLKSYYNRYADKISTRGYWKNR